MWKRLSLIFKAKAHRAVDRFEDPGAALDYSYTRQMQMLTKMRRALVDVSTARKAIENQVTGIVRQAETLTGQAEKALAMGREDLAREALSRKAALVPQINDLRAQHTTLAAEEEKLAAGIGQVQAKVAAFRTKKETIKASYAAAQAQVKIGESFAGLSGEMADLGHALARAEDKTLQLQARAGAVDELLASGALADPSGLSADPLTRELDQIAADSAVEAELLRLKHALGSTPTAGEIES